MRNLDYFKGKKITIIGFARSGLACANLLNSIGAQVSITDLQENDTIRFNASQLKSKDINLELGKHTKGFIEGRDLVIISPGVEENCPAVAWARQLNIPVISEIEVASILCPGTIIAVTGSNGKTTVTTLIAKILETRMKKVFTLGNIGKPFCAEVDRIKKDDFVSLEISSFQLENIDLFKPKISLILNFSCNHLDRYKDMQEYLEAKKRIFKNQDESDYLILNSADPALKALAGEARAKVVFFKETAKFNSNQAAVLAVGSILGIEEKVCQKVFREFKGIEHRLEEVAQINDIKFINDSKATTPESCIWALNNISSPVILIAGGKDKGVEYNVILDSMRGKVKKVILIGEAKKKIEEALGKDFFCDQADTLQEAVNKAYKKANSGDYILFSPMCSSFDMFSNYEERGRRFKEIVFELTKKERTRCLGTSG